MGCYLLLIDRWALQKHCVYFRFVSAFSFTCTRRWNKTEIKQSRLKQTWNKFCFISVLFQFYFTCKSRFSSVPSAGDASHLPVNTLLAWAFRCWVRTRNSRDGESCSRVCSLQYGLLFEQCIVTVHICWRSFPVAAARVTNDLPQHVTSAPSLPVLYSRLKTHLLTHCSPWLHSPFYCAS